MKVDKGSSSLASEDAYPNNAYEATVGDSEHSDLIVDSDKQDLLGHTFLRQDVAAGVPLAIPPVAQDRIWARAFMVNVIVTIVSAVSFGYLVMETISNDHNPDRLRRRLLSVGEDEIHTSRFAVVLTGFGVFGLAVALAVGLLHIMINCGKAVVWATFILIASNLAVMSVRLIMSAVPTAAIPPLVALVFLAYFFHLRKARLNFGAANLKVAALAIKSMPGTIRIALMMGIIQVVWCVFSVIAAVGSFAYLETVVAPDGTNYRAIYCSNPVGTNAQTMGETSGCMCYGKQISDDKCEYSSLGIPLSILWMCSMAWGCNVIKYVVTCTVSGSVASWWFLADDPAPVKGAFHRATKLSFGTLCKAALILRLVAMGRAILERILCFIPCMVCILRGIERGVSYLLTYTITFVGIYGLDFSAAQHRVRQLFMSRGVTTIANDTIVSMGLSLLAFVTSLAYIFISMLVLKSLLGGSSNKLNPEGAVYLETMMIFGFVINILLMSTILEVVRSGFKAVFVCFVQDADALKCTRGLGLYEELTMEWSNVQRIYPNVGSTNDSLKLSNMGSA